MNEYGKMATFYDLFYANKSYEKEVKFLREIIGNRKNVMDLGCGTGIHMRKLEDARYKVDGLDLSEDMLKIAKTRVRGDLFCGDLLEYETTKTYDVIISMFAVFNHLKSYSEFERGIMHWYSKLNPNGVYIIDLHNSRSSGEKSNTYESYKRIMKWDFNSTTFMEHTDIVYEIDGKVYKDEHNFIIYEVEKIKSVLEKNNLKYKLYEDYSFNVATDNSKNILVVIEN